MSTYPKLDPEFKKKWTDALRSGEYKQGEGKLFDSCTDSYCCLGVACIIQGNSEEDLDDRELIDRDTHVTNVCQQIRGSSLSMLKEYNPLVDKLTSMNDGHGREEQRSFMEIADWIDEIL